VLLIGKPVPTFPEALWLRRLSRAASTDSHPGEGRDPRKFRESVADVSCCRDGQRASTGVDGGLRRHDGRR